MASKIDRIAELLSCGVQTTQVAAIVGVTPSYISQLRADQDFKDHLNALIVEKAEQDTSQAEEVKVYKDKLAGAEHKIVDHILERLSYMGDNHAILALKAIGERRDAMDKATLMSGVNQALQQNGGQVRMVEVYINPAAVPDIQYGKNNEIVSIGSRSITPMPTTALQAMIDSEVFDHEHSVATA